MEKQHIKPVVILFTVLFLVMVGFGIVLPIIPFFIKKMGGGPVALGLFLTMYSLTQFFFAPFWGRLSDRIGRRPVLLIGLAGYGITFVLLGFAKSIWLLISIRALEGMMSSATLPTAMAYLADITEGSSRSKSMGIVGAANALGMVFGPVIGGWLGQGSFSVPFFVAGGLALLVLPVAFIFLPETLKKPSQRDRVQNVTISLEVLKDPLFILFGFYFVMNFTMALFESTIVLLAADKAGLGPGQIGTVFAILGLVAAVVQGGLIGKLAKTFGDARLVIYGALFDAIGMIMVLYSANRFLLVLSSSIIIIGMSLIGPASSSLASKGRSGSQGTSFGMMQSFGSLGRIIGPVTGGALYGLNIGLPYLTGAGLMVIMLLVGRKKISQHETKERCC